ncbi:MAG TPA: choline-sulfatase [Bacteroidales bacterium]|nr:choline-sulfatase [Bacteroidales bacterium]
MYNCQLITGCICGISMLTAAVSCQKKEHKPNILFILADDQRADAIGCAGNQQIKTPNIDRLAAYGLRFTNSYVMGGHHGAISAPSRAMLLSGMNLFNVYDKLEGIKTMPMHFAENDYVTFGTGKWHNEKSAFEESFQKGESVFLGGMADHFNIPVADMGTDGKLSEPEKKGFSTDLFAGAAVEFINEYAKGDKKNPFFCYVAFTVPHDPYSPRTDYIDRYSPESMTLPGNFMPLHPFAFDDLMVRDENLLAWPRPHEKVQEALADYYGLITHLDEKIGEIIKSLKNNGLYDNTIIVYAADNGLAIGSHGLLGKQNLYEHSMKVPLIITGPGIPRGKVSDALVYLFDLYPTLVEFCSLPSPEGIDGKSLMPLISGKSDEVRSSLFTVYRTTVRAVRTKEWKLIRYPERDYTQLFNLVNDPLELNNLAGVDGFETRITDMMKLMQELQKEVNDTVSLTANKILPLQYDHTRLVRKPDRWQPEYTLQKYFGEN